MNCDLCLHQFDSWNDARTHYLDKHNVFKPFLRCCNRKFSLRSRIIEHITWHMDPSAFQYVDWESSFETHGEHLYHIEFGLDFFFVVHFKSAREN